MNYADLSAKEQYLEEVNKRQKAINRISTLKKLIDQGEPRRPDMLTAIRSYKIHDGRMQRLEKWYMKEIKDVVVNRD